MVSLNKLARILIKARGYITIAAYTVVISDVMKLLKEFIMEWLMHKRFNQLVQRHIEETTEQEEISVEQTSENDISLKSSEVFNGMVNVTNDSENITKVEIE